MTREVEVEPRKPVPWGLVVFLLAAAGVAVLVSYGKREHDREEAQQRERQEQAARDAEIRLKCRAAFVHVQAVSELVVWVPSASDCSNEYPWTEMVVRPSGARWAFRVSPDREVTEEWFFRDGTSLVVEDSPIKEVDLPKDPTGIRFRPRDENPLRIVIRMK